MTFPSRVWPAVFALSWAWFALSGCNEKRFELSKKNRAERADISKRLLPRPLSTPKIKRPAVAPKLPSRLTLESKTSHSAGIRSLAVDPSGTFALSGGADRQLILWDLSKQKKVRSWRSFTGAIRRLQFSADGRRFVLIEGPTTLSSWSIQGTRLQQYKSPVSLNDVQFSPLGNRVLTVDQQGRLTFFQSTTLKQLQQHQVCPKGIPALQLAVDTAQRWTVVSCANGSIVTRKWDGSQTQTTQHGNAVDVMALSSKGDWLATASSHTLLTLWKLDANTLFWKKLHHSRGHLQSITTLRFHPNLPQLVTASQDRSVGVWHFNNTTLTLLRYLKHKSKILSVAFATEGNHNVLTGDSLGTLHLWSTSGHRIMKKEPPSGKARTLSFALRKDWLASDSAGKGSAIWDLKTGQQILSMKLHPFPVRHIQFARSGNRLLSADRRNIVFWDLQRRRPIGVINPPKQTYLTAATMGRDWTQVFYGMDRGGVDLWTLAGPKRLFRDRVPQCVTSVALHPLKRIAAAATCEGKLYLYDLRRYKLITRRQLEKQSIRQITFSSKGDRLLVLTTQRATLWQVPKLKQIGKVSHPEALLSAAFVPKSNTEIVLGSADKSLYRWSASGNKLQKLFVACTTPVRRIRFSPRNGLLAVACFDGHIRLWKWKPATHLATLVGLPDRQWLAYTPKLFFASSADALRHFTLGGRQKHWPLLSFKGWFQNPKQLQKQLSLVYKRSK